MAKKAPLEPIGNRVLVKRLESETALKGGIILPDSAKKKQEMAEVVATGRGTPLKNGELAPPPVVVGDKILIEKYAGQDVTISDEDYVILRGDDIIAIVS